MSDSQAGTAKPGPPIAAAVHEVRGFFPSDAALENGICALTDCGFDRADISLPTPGALSEATPDQGAEDPNTDDDNRQMRTLHAGLAGSAAALLAAGIVVGTGGAAAPAVAAAVAAGAAAGGVAHTASRGAAEEQHERREAAAASGTLVLAVRVGDRIKQAEAEAAMREAGATRIEVVDRA